jgi:hypothetical protein
MKPVAGLPQRPPPGLVDAIEAAGILLVNGENDQWLASDAAAAEAVIAAYDPMPYAVTEAKAALADYRWTVETGGVMFQGHPVITTRDAQGTITAAFLAAQAGQFPPGTRWKAADGVFFDMTAQSMAQLYATVAGHVQTCFARESQLVALIDAAATWEEVLAIDVTSGFPSNP